MAGNLDEMDIDSEGLALPLEEGCSGKRSRDSSDDNLTPRKRPRTSFWPSRRANQDPKVDTLCGTGKLTDLRAGCRSLPIEVRVVCKEVREKYLKLVVLDSSGERTVKAFMGCIEQFRNVEVNKLYRMDGYNVQAGYKESPDEIVMQSFTRMDPIERNNFPEVSFDFKGLEELESITNNTIVDVVGIITNVEPVTETSLGIKKREIVITDSSKTEISVFFWKNDVGLCDNLKPFSPIIIRFATKKSFGSEDVLWYSWKTQIVDDPIHGKAEELANWFREEAAPENIQF